MSIGVSSDQLQQAWQHLRQQWQQTVSLWDDAIRWQFEREFLQPLESQTPNTIHEMEHVAQVIAQARQNVH